MRGCQGEMLGVAVSEGYQTVPRYHQKLYTCVFRNNPRLSAIYSLFSFTNNTTESASATRRPIYRFTADNLGMPCCLPDANQPAQQPYRGEVQLAVKYLGTPED